MADPAVVDDDGAPKVRPLDAGGGAAPVPARPGASPPGRRLLVVVLASVVALIAGVVLGAQRAREDPPAAVTMLGLDAEQHGLSRVVDGLDDTLLAAATNGGQAMDLVLWLPRGALIVRPAPIAWTAVTIDQDPFEDFAAFDSSGRYVALATPVAREASSVVLAGRLEEIVAVSTDVTSYVWHVSEPHQLAMVVDDGARRTLELMLGAPRTVVVERELAPGEELYAWGPWGFLTGVGGVLRTSGTGIEIEGEFLGAGPTAIAVSTPEGIHVVDPASGVVTASLSITATAASFEPGTGRIVFTGPSGLVATEADGTIIVDLEHPFVERADWSSEGRFVAFADRVDVFVLDTETDTVTQTGLGPSEAVMLRAPLE